MINGYLAALIAARFTEDFGDDCHTARLGDVLRISTKTAKPQDHAGEIWEHYSIPAFDESHRPVMEPANEIKSNKYIVSRNSILISKLNPSIKRFWLPSCLTDHPVCSTEFIVFEPTRPENKSFYAAAISSNNFQNYLMAHVTGSTGSRQRAQPKSTLDFPMPNPSESAIHEFCSFADPIYAQMECCARESANLERLRDTLLPKLMSGEIDVSKVEVPTPPNSHLYLSGNPTTEVEHGLVKKAVRAPVVVHLGMFVQESIDPSLEVVQELPQVEVDFEKAIGFQIPLHLLDAVAAGRHLVEDPELYDIEGRLVPFNMRCIDALVKIHTAQLIAVVARKVAGKT